MTGYIKKIFVVTISLFLFACGINEQIVHNDIQQTNGLFTQALVDDNKLIVNTTEEIYLRFEYFQRIDGEDKYLGWSVKEKSDEFTINLPCKNINSQYYIKVRAENEKAFQDTVFFFYSSNTNYSFLEMHFIDVEQGDAIYIKTPENNNIIIDGGYGTRGNNSTDWQGFGQPLALNYLNEQNIDHFDYIIETHHHADHYGGLNDIKNSGNYTWDYDLSNSNTYNYHVGDLINLKSDVQFRILSIGYPPAYNQDNLNNTSIVLKVNYGYADYLLTGDAEGAVQTFMIQNPWGLSADLFKVSHHGSSTNSTCNSTFLDAIFTKYTKIGIISFGTNNSYGHPKALYRFANDYIFGTGTPPTSSPYPNHYFNCGTIKTYSDGQAIIVNIE
ncbi:MAG TPA: MBL fold metallo-hydrolase [Candidatus Cloacimonadota bacterium]|jgi:beta-lactamase superfamily II metal-dependent hydrolase|nr:MBL fold metallo-hydrolase [Candidatus Cloacimonadales bacterium]HPY95585.1 MBL fold metallo-hydrolase [Candidatus Cloacimonadota bacterium]HQB40153.1 MBL fold metallo-hydrolase [Candidatus Cloacimonadota bacterium]